MKTLVQPSENAFTFQSELEIDPNLSRQFLDELLQGFDLDTITGALLKIYGKPRVIEAMEMQHDTSDRT